jgi:membrane associated rhomboid family serine protease
MLPIGDDNSDRIRTPFVNYMLIAANVLVFVFLQGMGADLAFTYSYSTVPGEILTGQDIVTDSRIMRDPYTNQRFELPGLGITPVHVWLTLITSMFMHGGWAHLGGNMLYLWVFGDNLENRLGHIRYLFFYLLVGIIASLTHVITTNVMGHNLLIPSLGASGAISGVLGAYLLLYPTRSVHVFFVFTILSVPALVALGVWIVFQIIRGMGGDASNVAYAAHIGGFFAGLLLIKFFDPGKPAVVTSRDRDERSRYTRHYR